MARWIQANGTEQIVHPANRVEFTLEEMKTYIGGGYLEAVPFTRTEIMYVDEEGVLKQLPLNEKASEELSLVRGRPIPICGDVLIASKRETGDEE